MTFPVTGPFPQLMSLLDALERSPRFLTVESIAYDDHGDGKPPVITLGIAAYLDGVEEGDDVS